MLHSRVGPCQAFPAKSNIYEQGKSLPEWSSSLQIKKFNGIDTKTKTRRAMTRTFAKLGGRIKPEVLFPGFKMSNL